ncbi:MAG: hypothetical protein GY717_11430 [Rhodobacteraceae bacterium]|nr:hypothetical protein [Paracoccaceae bacterium]
MRITDFTRGEDLLAIGVEDGLSNLSTLEIRPSADGNSTEVILGARVIRIEGVTDFDETDLRIGSYPEEFLQQDASGPPLLDGLGNIDLTEGTSGADTISVTASGALHVLDSGAGDDNLTVDGNSGPVKVQSGEGNDTGSGTGDIGAELGDGDDVFTGSTGEFGAHGGAGDDSLSGDGKAVQLDGEAGDDTLFASAGTEAILLGGEGADLLTAEADTQSDTLDGGPGSDTLIGGLGDTFFLDRGYATRGANTAIVNVTADTLGQGPAVISQSFEDNYNWPAKDEHLDDSVVLNIPAAMMDTLTIEVIASSSTSSTTEIRPGGVPIVNITEDVYDLPPTDWSTDPRLTVNWI